MKKTLVAFALIFSALLGGALPAHAADAPQFQFQPIVSIPLPTGGKAVDANTSLTDYLNAVFSLAIGIAAILGVIMITFDGFQYMASDVVGKKQKALEGLQGAAFGLVLLLLSYVILHVINPNILNLSLLTEDLGSLGSGGTSSDAQKAAASGKQQYENFTVPPAGVSCNQLEMSDPAKNSSGAFEAYYKVDNTYCPNLASGRECCAIQKIAK